MLLIAYGTRPEWIKIKPIINMLDEKHIQYKLLFTGQHTTLINEKYDEKITITPSNNRLDSIFLSILGIDTIFHDIDRVMVQGDTASAFAVSLAAFHRKLPIIHLEAGLRTYDNENPYPEESYRKCISSIATIHLCPTEYNQNNLEREQVNGKIYVVGNTAIDSLLPHINKITGGGGCLITLHRRENHPLMNDWLISLNSLASKHSYPFVFIAHPNLNLENNEHIKNLKIISPVSHDEMINMIVKTDIIISDSGGMQEEASFFHKPIIVCRKITERPESINITSFMCKTPEQLENIFDHVTTAKIKFERCPYGDGHSAEKIIDILYG